MQDNLPDLTYNRMCCSSFLSKRNFMQKLSTLLSEFSLELHKHFLFLLVFNVRLIFGRWRFNSMKMLIQTSSTKICTELIIFLLLFITRGHLPSLMVWSTRRTTGITVLLTTGVSTAKGATDSDQQVGFDFLPNVSYFILFSLSICNRSTFNF